MVELLAGSKFNLYLTPFYTPLHSLSILLFTVLLYLLSTPPFSSQVTRPSPPYDQPPFDTPSLNSLSILLFTVLLFLLSTPPFYIPFLHSFFNQSLLPLLITCHKTTPRSKDHPPNDQPPFTLPLCIPFLYSSLQFFSTSTLLPLSPHRSQDHSPPRMVIPPLTLPIYIPFLSSVSFCVP